ncbi:MAG: SURF1 family protein [Arachnia sp.]
MRRLILRWVALALTLITLAIVFVRLGEWQLSRLEQRREQNSAVAANRDAAPVDYQSVMGAPISEDDQWQQVRVSGTYTGEQYQVRYRNVDGSPGIEVVAVMSTDQGEELLIDRGFIPRQNGQPDTEVLPELPAGTISVVGYVRRDEQGDQTATAPHEFKVRLINSEAIGTQLGRSLVPGYVSLISSEPANDTDLVPLSPPEPSEGNHFSYALQWFSFGLIALVGIVVLVRADLADRKKAQARQERAHTAGPDDAPH